MISKMTEVFDMPRSLLAIIRTEWPWWVAGGIFSFVLASVLMTGWPDGIWPELSFPYTYQGDGLSHSWLALRAIEGWIFDNPRSGYPFGSNFLDYPGSDSGNLLVLKLLGLLTGEYHSALNLFFLTSFFASFTTAFCTLRALNLSKALAVAAALLFTFLPFHFQRLGHLFYLWYFVTPIFFYLGFLIYHNKGFSGPGSLGVARIFLIIVAFFFLASFGVYYALFGVLVLATSAIAVFFRTTRAATLFLPFAAIAAIVFGVIINVAPNVVNRHINGGNPEVAVRSPAEAEVYGLKFMQLLLPRLGHRDEHLASLTDRYSKTYPLINENSTASLGLVGAAGFVGAFLLLVAGMAERRLDSRLSLFALFVLVLFLFGTIGGLGTVFSSIISSSIRGWNRISVFIAFGSIAIFFLALHIFVFRYFSESRAKVLTVIAALFFSFIGLYDQTVSACTTCNEQTKMAFERDREFVAAIERALPRGSAVYQLPYMPFPEVAPLNRLHTYDLSVGFLHSKELRWSYAGMKGRQGDLFYRALAQEPIEKQLDAIRRLGFAGIYIDRRGFEDNADLLIERLTLLLGNAPLLKRTDGEIVFFQLDVPQRVDLNGLSAIEIMRRAGYVIDRYGPRHSAKFSEGVDFTRLTWPEFIKDVQGVSGPEPWGRWSDARLDYGARFDFFSPLPTRFTLHLSARPFGRNGEQEILVKVGDQTHRVTLRTGDPEIRLPIVLTSDRVDSIEFIPQEPVSPKELGINDDVRKLGIGFVRMHFEE